MIHQIRLMMEKSELWSKIVPRVQKTRLMQFRHMQITKRKEREFQEECMPQLKKLAEILEDDFSRQTLWAVLEYRRTFRESALKDVYVKPQYFQKDIVKPVQDEVFIDGGAYTGDTIEALFRFGGGTIGRRFLPGSLKKSIAGS